jgi:octaprenyl-diphosphate synthase
MSSLPARTSHISSVESFVEAVESRLGELLEPTRELGSGILEEATSHLALAEEAKRARPRLVYHFGRALEVEPSESIRVATAGELVHTASLLHDDVVDGGTERRGRPTVNVRWNNIVSILGGDLMLCKSLEELQPFEQVVSDAAVDVVERMTRGIMMEVEGRQRVDLTVRDWHAMASGKTGALLEWCASTPARIADRPHLVDRLGRCGYHLGLAFQMADDLRDLVDTDSGKDRFADLHTGSPSRVVIAALEMEPRLASRLEAFWEDASSESIDEIVEALLESGAVEHTRDCIADEVDRALEALGRFRAEPGGDAIVRWARRLCLDVETSIDQTV